MGLKAQSAGPETHGAGLRVGIRAPKETAMDAATSAPRKATARRLEPVAVALVGPTACGKSAIAEEIAASGGAEIVNMDSAAVYKGMDVGTAKPSARDMALTRHWLFDVAEPTERYGAAHFLRDAQSACADIRSRGKIPLFCGGTMMYLKTMIDGLSELPEASAAARARVARLQKEKGTPGLRAMLERVDPEYAQRIEANDPQRTIRALESYLTTGAPFSRSLRENPPRPAFGVAVLAMAPSSKPWLHPRIARRFDAMLQAGLIEETAELRRRLPDLRADMPSMRCVGYRQVWEYLEGKIDHAAMRANGMTETRRLAKRQMTWLRKLPLDAVVDPVGKTPEQTLRECQNAYEKLAEGISRALA